MKLRSLFLSLFACFCLAAAPVMMAFLSWASSGFQGSMLSEGGAGHGTWIWFMFYSLPLSALAVAGVLVFHFVLVLQRYARKDPEKTPPPDRGPG